MSGLGVLKVAEDLLRRRRAVFESIKTGQNLNRFLLNANLAIILFAAIYGATMGAYPGGVQVLYNIVKVPLLLLVSIYVALPTYYVLDAFSGGDTSLRQTASVIIASFGIMSTILLAFLPVNLFFILTTPGQGFQTYAFIVLLNVAIFTIAGIAGLAYQYSGIPISFGRQINQRQSMLQKWPNNHFSQEAVLSRDAFTKPSNQP